MKITVEWMHRNSTGLKGHGWTDEQLKIIGLSYRFIERNKGWLKALEGREISREAAAKFAAIGLRERMKKEAERVAKLAAPWADHKLDGTRENQTDQSEKEKKDE